MKRLLSYFIVVALCLSLCQVVFAETALLSDAEIQEYIFSERTYGEYKESIDVNSMTEQEIKELEEYLRNHGTAELEQQAYEAASIYSRRIQTPMKVVYGNNTSDVTGLRVSELIYNLEHGTGERAWEWGMILSMSIDSEDGFITRAYNPGWQVDGQVSPDTGRIASVSMSTTVAANRLSAYCHANYYLVTSLERSLDEGAIIVPMRAAYPIYNSFQYFL